MPKIKKVKVIKSKIKEIEDPLQERKKSELESEIKSDSVKKELQEFAQVLQGSSKSVTPLISQTEVPQVRPHQTGGTVAEQPQDAERAVATSYADDDSPDRQPYSASRRIRGRNVYDPSIKQEVGRVVDPTTTPAQLQDRALQGQRFIGQDDVQGHGPVEEQRSDTYEEQGKRRRGAEEGG